MNYQEILQKIELFKKTSSDEVSDKFPREFENFILDFSKFVYENPNFNQIALFNEKNVYSLNNKDFLLFELIFLQILFLDKNFFNEYSNYNFKNIFFAFTIYSKEYYDYRNCFIYYKLFNYDLEPLKYFEATNDQLKKIKTELDKLIPSDLQNLLSKTINLEFILNLDFTITELREQKDNQINNDIQFFKNKNFEEFINKIDYSIGIKYENEDLYILKKIKFINKNKNFYDILKYLIFCFDNSALQTTLNYNQMYEQFKSLDIFDLDDEYTERERFIKQKCEIFIKTTFKGLVEIYLKNIKINLNRIILYTFFIYVRTFINRILNEELTDNLLSLKNLLLEIALYNFIIKLKEKLLDYLKIQDEEFINLFLININIEINTWTKIYIDELNKMYDQKKTLEAVQEIKVPVREFNKTEEEFQNFLKDYLSITNYDYIFQMLSVLGYDASIFTDLEYSNFLDLKNNITEINNNLLSDNLLSDRIDIDLIDFIKKWSIAAYEEYFKFNLDVIISMSSNNLLSWDKIKLFLLEYININDINFNKNFLITDFTNVSQENLQIINVSFNGITEIKQFIIDILEYIIKNLDNLTNYSLLMNEDDIKYVQKIFNDEKDSGKYYWIQGFIKALLINFKDNLIKQYTLFNIPIVPSTVSGLIFPLAPALNRYVPLIQNSPTFHFSIPPHNNIVDPSTIYINPNKMSTLIPILDKLTYNDLLLDNIIGKYINFQHNYYNILLFYCPLTDNNTLAGYTIWDCLYQSAYFGNFYQNPNIIENYPNNFINNKSNQNMLTLNLTYPNTHNITVSFNNSETAFQYCKFIRLRYILDTLKIRYNNNVRLEFDNQLRNIQNFNRLDGVGAIREKRSDNVLNVYDPFSFNKYRLLEDFSYGLSSDLSGSFINSSNTYTHPSHGDFTFRNIKNHNFFVNDRDYIYLSGVSPDGTKYNYNMFKIIDLLYDKHFNVVNSNLLSNIDALDQTKSYLNNIKIMYLIIFKKFTNPNNKYFDNKTLLTRIKNSREYYLIEHNENYDIDLHWSDNVMGNGLNLLGELSMILSEHLSIIEFGESEGKWLHINLLEDQFYKIYSKFDSMKKQKYFANNLPGDNIILRLNAIFTKQYYFNYYKRYDEHVHSQILDRLILYRNDGITNYIDDIPRGLLF